MYWNGMLDFKDYPKINLDISLRPFPPTTPSSLPKGGVFPPPTVYFSSLE